MIYQTIYTNSAPEPIGPYSQATEIFNKRIIFISGQIGLNPSTGNLVSENFEDQVHQAIENIRTVIEAAGGNINNIVKYTLFLTDLNKFSLVNSIMHEIFKKPFPSRSTIEAKGLPKGAQFEIEAIAAI
ncbi:MAG: RidA family protein [Bordetella sp.]|nr:MAG: RidA family protein [Bordetella sp.]